jgi:hypothetical protein
MNQIQEALGKLNDLGMGVFGLEEKPGKFTLWQLYKVVNDGKLYLSPYHTTMDMRIWLDGYLQALKSL